MLDTGPDLLYQESAPRLELQAYVPCFWMIKSAGPTILRDRTFPDGCPEIVVSLDTTVLRSDDGGAFSANPAVELVGQMTKPYDIITQGRNWFFGVKFYPHTLAAFTQHSNYDLRDQSISMRDLLGPTFMEAVEYAVEAPSFERFVAAMERYFLGNLAAQRGPQRAYRLVDQAVRSVLRFREPEPMARLPQQLEVSERYLQLIFKQHVGLSPKHLSKLIRFQRSFRYLHDRRLSLAAVAQQCGYYDQAHFAHDFKSLTGMSPSAYLSMESPLNSFFFSEGSRAYVCGDLPTRDRSGAERPSR